ncbi:MAG TPA: UDP-N-acetylmuramoyl-tripeptide--D-alanyl-D-alanine ligase [Thermoanaerobaculia bacterium]|nr:UDP-N-acetylmuramoyl-tripeptide--D-alanyl-D-alanine ligase [Thermoanaerobaculia bacterium]
MGGRVAAGDGAATWRGAAFDSRKIQGNELFFALRGGVTDGHRYVAAAIAAGAGAAVIHQDLPEGTELPPGANLIRVDDTYEALHALTRHVRFGGAGHARVPRRLVSITGSAGKTTTKELVTAVLGRRYRVAKNEGNFNNLYGFPLSLLGIPEDTEWMVAEMGMSSAGELSQLSRLSRPEVVVYTNVRPVHLEFFDSVRGIAEAKAELLEGLVPGGLVVANADDPEVRRFVRREAERRHAAGDEIDVAWYGRGGGDGEGPAPKVTARDVGPAGGGEPGSRFTLVVAGDGGGEVEVHLPVHGEYNVENFLAAAACGVRLGVPLAEIAAGAAQVRSAAGRGSVHRLPGGGLLIDDTYNSNPDALRRALASAAELAAGRADAATGRRWAVLGDMLELGPEGPRFHRECGAAAAELGFAPVAGVGELCRELVAGARASGAEARWFATAGEAADALAGALAPGDVVLVKGSRGVGLDRVVERLLAAAGSDDPDPDDADQDEGNG